MHSIRMIRIQKQAKRRLIAMTIIAAAISGYNSRSIFAADEQPSQSQIAKMASKPGVKAVGIRLINPNGDPQTTGSSAAPQRQSMLPVPSQNLPLLPSLPSLPPSRSAMLPPMPSAAISASAQPLQTVLPPAPAYSSTSGSPASGFSLLPAPPRMSEVLPKNSTGKVVVKLGGSSDVGSRPEGIQNQTQSVGVAESFDSHVVPPRPLGTPAKMPPFLFEKSAKKVVAANEESVSNASQSAVRISIVDSSSPASTNSEVDPLDSSPVPIKNRTPQLIKPKPTQLGHTVVLAQSTDIDVVSSNNQPDEFVPPVEVDASLVPNSIAYGVVGSNFQNARDLKSGGGTKAVVSDTVDDAFISFVTPAIGPSSNGPKLAATKDIRELGFQLDPVEASESIDKSRRTFDTLIAGQALSATVELECLAATSMDMAAKLTALAVQDESVCKVLHNGRTVSLVGNQVGTTLVQIWTSELGDTPQVIRVNVAQQRGKVQATRNEVKDIKQVIAQGFPRADVNIVSQEDGAIEVRGTTDSEESAKRILELVRKLYLVPVKDKLTVVN